mmetsp:Transcript_2112/g.9258  ORF Transcript_2112/g.9258 Transcript_2112/m.9258 type:complete len:250 (-) Transcript_2112:28-777(-)|eukprot:scaffold5443_cov291-Pinguiococcus_pyrenoidosus.AAC.10
MGRYSSGETFHDQNAKNPQLSYAQAKGGGDAGQKAGAARPEKVMNVMGSCAGAGSSEFHHYRHTRRAELDRLAKMDEEAERQRIATDFYKRKLAQLEREEEKTSKRSAKRKRRKEKRRKMESAEAAVPAAAGDAKDLEKRARSFTYIPMDEQPDIVNDGSFMERIRKQLEGDGAPETSEVGSETVRSSEASSKERGENGVASVKGQRGSEAETGSTDAASDGEASEKQARDRSDRGPHGNAEEAQLDQA